MNRNIAETILGALVIGLALFFLIFSYRAGDAGDMNGYKITADFSGTGGLKTGDDVVVSGVKVGQVESITLQPETYLARVEVEVAPSVKLPTDTAAAITSAGLLGGRYVELQPGSDEEFLKPGGHIEYTQAPQNLEQLLGKFIFSVQDSKNKSADAAAPTATPAQAPTTAPPASKAEDKPQTAPATPTAEQKPAEETPDAAPAPDAPPQPEESSAAPPVPETPKSESGDVVP